MNIFIVFHIIIVIISTIIGSNKGKGWQGFFLGLFLGVIGLIIISSFKKNPQTQILDKHKGENEKQEINDNEKQKTWKNCKTIIRMMTWYNFLIMGSLFLFWIFMIYRIFTDWVPGFTLTEKAISGLIWTAILVGIGFVNSYRLTYKIYECDNCGFRFRKDDYMCHNCNIHFNMTKSGYIDNYNDCFMKTNVDDYDKHVLKFPDSITQASLKAIKIGTQIWMAENAYIAIPKGPLYLGSWVYNNDWSQYETGFLYELETAKNVCPTGWHLPTKHEVEVMLSYAGRKDKSLFYRLIDVCFIQVKHDYIFKFFGGYRDNITGRFNGKGEYSFFWTQTKSDSSKSYVLIVNKETRQVRIGTMDDKCGCSLRYIRDTNY